MNELHELVKLAEKKVYNCVMENSVIFGGGYSKL